MAKKKQFQHPDNAFYAYQYGTVFTNGGMEFGFLMPTETPLFTVNGGGRIGGWRATRPFRPIAAVPLAFNNMRVPVAGIGGVQAGFVSLQPLIEGVGD